MNRIVMAASAALIVTIGIVTAPAVQAAPNAKDACTAAQLGDVVKVPGVGTLKCRPSLSADQYRWMRIDSPTTRKAAVMHLRAFDEFPIASMCPSFRQSPQLLIDRMIRTSYGLTGFSWIGWPMAAREYAYRVVLRDTCA